MDNTLRALCDAGDIDAATTMAIEHYGPGVLGMMVKMTGDPDEAGDVFSMWCEDVWRGLRGFGWRSSLKTWSYRVAMSAMARYQRTPYHKRGRLLQTGELAQVATRVRDSTLVYLRTDMKDRFRAIRKQLSDEENALLILRIDRGMAWKEVAEVMLDGVDAPTEAQLKRESNRLRQCFLRVTTKLKKLAEREGLLDDYGD